MADITRFDFHALRFVKSEKIMEMSNEEIGQYILLLSEAWLGGKDTTIPDSPEILARLARCKKVSDKVLDQFPVVSTQWGPRRRNETLFGEWVIVNQRVATASEKGRLGNDVRWGKDRSSDPPAIPQRSPGRFHRESLTVARPDPTRSDSTQPDPTRSDSGSFGQGTFKNISIRYSTNFKVNHSKAKSHMEKYQKACERYGEDKVLEYFEIWSEGAGWLKERHDTNGLNFFWKPMEEIAEGDQNRIARDVEVKKENAPEISDEQAEKIIEQVRTEGRQEVDAQLEKIRADKKFAEEHAGEI